MLMACFAACEAKEATFITLALDAFMGLFIVIGLFIVFMAMGLFIAFAMGLFIAIVFMRFIAAGLC